MMAPVPTRPITWLGSLLLGGALVAGCGTSPRAAPNSVSRSSSAGSPTTSVPASTAPTPGTSGNSGTSGTSATQPYTGPALTSVDSVSCADATHCWAGASAGTSGDESAILASTDGGAIWSVQQTMPGVTGTEIDCPSDTHCMVSGNRTASGELPLLLSTTDGGKAWSSQPLSGGMNEVDAVSCANDLDCWLVGGQPQTEDDVIVATTNWGGSWTVQDHSSLEVSMGVGYGLSCPSTSDCVVVGIGALTTTDGGTTWLEHAVTGELNVAFCPSVSRCVAEEDSTSAVPSHESTTIATSDDGGASWQDVETVGGDVGVLDSLSCPTTSHCVSVGNGYTDTAGGSILWGAVETTADGGATWTGTEESRATNLFGVSCATATSDCVAVGYSAPADGTLGGSGSTGVIFRSVDDGSTWTEQRLP